MVFSQFIRGQIIAHNKEGKSVRQISEELNIPKSTVQDILNLYKKEGHCDPKISSGRPQMIDKSQGEMIIERVQIECETTAADIANDPALNPDNLTRQRINNFLNKEGLVARRMIKAQKVSEKNKYEWYNWALRYESYDYDDFSQIYFSDESLLCSQKSGIKWIRKYQDEDYTSDMVKGFEQFNGGKQVMIWGLIGSEGPISFHRVIAKLNSDSYINQILDNYVKTKFKNKTIYFQQDNAKCHSSSKCQDWFKKNKVNTLPLPAQSPDINIIEQVWSFIKNQLWNKRFDIRNKDDLFLRVKDIFFSQQSTQLINTLYQSLPSRIEHLIEGKGQQISLTKINKQLKK